jgi:glycosyltransferase involved in cell wall biosynthesis
MGIDDAEPKPKELLLRKKIKQLKSDDFVLLWTGGIWDWFDAKLIIRAMSLVDDSRVKLVFLGTKHPNSIYKKEMRETVAARKLSEELGLTDKSVFFLDGWVPYDKRAAYLADANAAIYADKQSLETRFSHRTRVLDHIWTQLPTICSRGDYLSEVIEKEQLGIVVNRKVSEFVEAIQKLSSDKRAYDEIKSNIRGVAAKFAWDTTLAPLVTYLSALDVKDVQKDIQRQYEITIHSTHAPKLKQRIKHSAKILLGK